jgi:hypothetical protein
MNATISMREAKRLYTYGNYHGGGYLPYADVPALGPHTVDTVIEAASADGWSVSDDIAVLVDGDGTLLGVGGDAMGRNPWAVVLSDEVEALAAWDAANEAVST